MRNSTRLGTIASALILMALACSLPVIGGPAAVTPTTGLEGPTLASPPSAALETLPPSVIETVPAQGEELDPRGNLTFYFDQPMDPASVEAAFAIQPSAWGSFSWPRSDTLRFAPSQPWERDTSYQFSFASTALSAADINLPAPLSFMFHTAGYIQVTQVVPQSGSTDVDPTSVITVVFNRPIVPLQFEGDLPQPLTFEPAVEGSGEWIDTGVYVFRPKDSLAGGTQYTVTVGAGLIDTAGGILQEPYSWSFVTSLPRLVSIAPLDVKQLVGLQDPVVLTFNQTMDAGSVERAFNLHPSSSTIAVSGEFQWDDAGTSLTFTPLKPLTYATAYTLELSVEAHAAGGVALTDAVQAVFRTVPLPSVSGTSPTMGGVKPVYNSVEFTFNAPMDQASLIRSVRSSPELENQGAYWQAETNTLVVYGDFQPSTFYRITIGATAHDPFGTSLAEPFELTFTTGHLPAMVEFTRFSEVVTLSTERDPVVELQARNVSRIDLALYDLGLDEYQALLQSGTYLYRNPSPAGSLRTQWSEFPSLTQDVTKTVQVSLQNDPLPSGTYLLTVRSLDDESGTKARLIVVRDTELVFKATTTEGFVWAVDLASGNPVTGLPIHILDERGAELGSGKTGEDGTATISIPRQDDPYARVYAATGSPGAGRFGYTGSHWSSGVEPYEFGIPQDLAHSEFFLYLYTDRPIYRPGQTVSYRGIMRHVGGARYALPDMSDVDLEIRDPEGKIVHQASELLSSFGTFNGQFNLSDEAALGPYVIQTDYGILTFDVAAYRKPEFTVAVTPSSINVAAGDALTASIEAEHYFGGGVASAQVRWSAWAIPLHLSGLPQPIDWLSAGSASPRPFAYGSFAEGEGTTDANGRLEIDVPTDDLPFEPAQVTIEVTLTDSSGLPVTGEGVANVHPATLYFGVVPASYALRAGETAEVEATAVDWSGHALPGQTADLTVERITWTQTVDDTGQIVWEEQPMLVNRGQGVTTDDGSIRFSFRPSTGGTYRVRATGRDAAGRQTSGEATVWVSGSGGGIWRQPSAGKIGLVADKERYDPGDTAQILIPSPFSGTATALVTIERESVLSHEVMQIRPDSGAIQIPIDGAYAPNVFLTVTLIRPGSADEPPAIAVGMLALSVNRSRLEFRVTLSPSAEQAGPGEPVTYRLQALDSAGQPVQAEFSMALTDLAALSLAEPNSLPPVDAFYGDQPLQVRTGASLVLTGEAGPLSPQIEGIGGGGGEGAITSVRSEFPDTAYWNPSVITDGAGRAEIELTLPDSLTTWRMDVRGVTDDTRVGAATVDIVATKPLLIRPETPRFFTAGDAASVAAVVHNNTPDSLPLEARLIAGGAEITSSASVSFSLAAGESRRVDWDLTIQDTDAVDLTFHVSGGGLEDASKPTIGSAAGGALPVLRYTAPQTAATAGSLENAEARLEAMSLPRTFSASQGELRVEADPSLGSAMDSALTALNSNPYQSTEQVVSRFLSNLVFYNALDRYGLGDLTQRARLESVLNQSLQTLYNRQLSSGGWGWWTSGPAESYTTAYVVLALAKAKALGLSIDETTQDEAIGFVRSSIVPGDLLTTTELRNRQAFLLYCLEAAGEGDPASIRQLTEQRGILSVWAEALLLPSLADLSPNDPAVDALRSDLETAAARSASGVSWQDEVVDRWNLGSSVRTTAQALQALLAVDPDNPLAASAVRWILAARSRDGAWSSSHETAWALLALARWLEVQGGLQGDFTYQVSLNGQTLTEGQAQPGSLLTSVTLTEPIADLLPDQPNQLSFRRGEGPGSLFYTAHLTVYRPVEDVTAQSRGLSVSRRYFHYDGRCGSLDDPCPEAASAEVGEDLLVRVSLIVPSDQYYIVVEDPFPAGTEPIDRGLSTSPLELPTSELIPLDALQKGLGWWRFTRTEVRDDHLALFADYLPAGTYQYDYVLHAAFAGEYRVLPTVAWALYFPEVYGQGAGTVYTIRP